MKRFTAVLLVLSLALVGCGQQRTDLEPISGSYEVVPEESNINFTSIKNQDIGVSGFFDEVSGSVTVPDDGTLTGTSGEISLDLTSLDSGLDIRDKRVLKHFFETDTGTENAENSRAVFELSSLKSESVDQLKTLNQSVKLIATGTMNLHGESVEQAMELLVTRTGNHEVRITTRKPYVFNVEKFNMVDPLEKLMEVCGHKDLSLAVPIDINLTLRQS